MARSVPWEIDDTLITPDVLNAVKHVESRGNPNAVSPAGAVGPYQFMPATARRFGLSDPRHEPSARDAAARYLTQLAERYGGDVDKALLAYNWGEGNVDSYLKGGRGVKGQPMPVEAHQYVQKVRSAQGQVGGKQPQGVPWEIDDTVPGYKAPEQPKALQQSLSQRAVEATLAEMPWYERALVGAGKAAADVGRTFGLGSAEPEADKALTEDTAGMLGNVAGEIGMTLAPGTGAFRAGSALTKAAGLAKGAQLIGGGAAAGATGEALLNRDPLVGAAIGGAFAPLANVAGRGLNSLTKQGQRLFSGAEGLAAERGQQLFKEGDRLPQAISALRATQPIVPGEMPTAMRAATAELPELAVVEHQARTGPQARLFNQADEATARARSQVLGNIEAPGVRPKDPVTGRPMESGVEEARRLNTAPLYDAAMPEQVAIPRDLQAALQGSGAVGQAARNVERDFLEAARLARAQGTAPPPRGRSPANAPYQNMSVYQVQRLIAELDAIPFAQRDFNVTNARRLLSQLARQQSPNYGQATDLFRAMSAPQNQADVAGTLRQAIEAPTNPDVQRATVFANALRNAPGTIKKSGISAPFQSVEEIFASNPQGMQAIRNVEGSLMREARTNAMLTNQNIAPKFRTVQEEIEKSAPGMLLQAVTIARGVLKKWAGVSEPKIQKILDESLVNPQAFADLLERLPPTQRNEILNQIRAAGANQNIEARITAPAVGQFRKGNE